MVPLDVPGNWTMQGHGAPHYTNVRMPFDCLPPDTPADNPTGLYRKRFELPAGFVGKRLVLHFAGVESCFSVWLNGVPIGFGKDSRLPTELDVSHAARAGENVLAVEVLKWSDASFLEDQDHWWQAGIHRDVYLYATEPVFVQDVFARAGFDASTGTGALELELRAGGVKTPGYRFVAELFDAADKPLLREPIAQKVPFGGVGFGPVDGLVLASVEVGRVSPWSAESPTLYTLVVSLLDPEGREIEATRTRIGFRSIGIESRELRVNGKRVLLKGVNRHDHHETRGKAVDRSTMLGDIQLLKRFNFNAVRCSHYPNDPAWLELCDEHGLYVIDEANIEGHHYYQQLPNDPRYTSAFMDRATRMLLRDRNHPSVILWSLGNETGYGACHDAMAAYLRHADGTRPIHYEGAITRDWSSGRAAIDVICPMYPSIEELVRFARTTSDQRPIIPCEYAHAMGNSCGNLAEYWAAFESTPGLQGGFIWELLDHGIKQRTADGRDYYAYGGDFGDEPNDLNFCCDGLVGADRSPHPAMWEVKRLLQPVSARLLAADGSVLEVQNKYDFISLEHLSVRYELLVDGTVVTEGPLPRLSAGPGASERVSLALAAPSLSAGEECHLNLRFHDTREALLGAGHEVAVEQLVLSLPARPAAARGAAVGPALSIRAQSSDFVIENAGCRLRIERDSGSVVELCLGNSKHTSLGPELCVWRAPTDNDGIKILDMKRDLPESELKKPLSRWMDAGLDQLRRRVDELSVEQLLDGSVQIRLVCVALGASADLPIRESRELCVHGSGVIECRHFFEVAAGLPDLPRLGVRWRLPEQLEQLCWLGAGPHESYVDRKAGALVGRYSGSVTGQYVPYVMPQEHGNKTDVRFLSLRDEQGSGLLFSARGLLDANASRYSIEQLTSARHTFELEPEPLVHLHLDARQRGLGGRSCGPDTLPQYRIGPGRYELAYCIIPLGPGDDPALLHRGVS